MIEKNIFQSWWTKDLHPLFKKRIDYFKEMNPEFTYYLYDDNDMDNFVNNHFKGEISECYNKLNIIVAKVDFWRYLVLYKYGGIYLDAGHTIVKENFKNLIENNETNVLKRSGAIIFNSQAGYEKRRLRSRRSKRNYNLQYTNITGIEKTAIENFYNARSGAFEPFPSPHEGIWECVFLTLYHR